LGSYVSSMCAFFRVGYPQPTSGSLHRISIEVFKQVVKINKLRRLKARNQYGYVEYIFVFPVHILGIHDCFGVIFGMDVNVI